MNECEWNAVSKQNEYDNTADSYTFIQHIIALDIRSVNIHEGIHNVSTFHRFEFWRCIIQLWLTSTPWIEHAQYEVF